MPPPSAMTSESSSWIVKQHMIAFEPMLEMRSYSSRDKAVDYHHGLIGISWDLLYGADHSSFDKFGLKFRPTASRSRRSGTCHTPFGCIRMGSRTMNSASVIPSRMPIATRKCCMASRSDTSGADNAGSVRGSAMGLANSVRLLCVACPLVMLAATAPAHVAAPNSSDAVSAACGAAGSTTVVDAAHR